MFARVRDFLYRHRHKFLVGALVVGGATMVRRYAERKMLEWQEQRARTLVEEQKRLYHYDNTLRTATATVLSLSPSMKEVISSHLDADALLHALRDQPQHKRHIWEQLKVVGFSRAAATIYVGSLVAGAIRVQLMLLGGYTFREVIGGEGEAIIHVTQSLQQRYLSAVHFLVEQGTPKLVERVSAAVICLTTGLPLTHSLNLTQLETIFHEIRLSLTGEGTTHEAALQEEKLETEPWSRYVLLPPVPPEDASEEDKVLYNMLVETMDILDSDDFKSVMDSLIQHGTNLVLDRMADFYPLPKVTEESASSENWVDNVSRDVSGTADMGDSSNFSQPSCSTATLASTPPPFQNSFINKSSMPVAKLVPVLSGVVHGALSPAPGQLLHKLLTNDKLDTLGANVYEAFASDPSN